MLRFRNCGNALSLYGAIVACCLLLIPVMSFGQDRWEWPDSTENLQVLPKDWSGKRLRPVMQGFTRALGVRCSHCHVGEEGQPLSTYDFPSDKNPKKDVARAMLKMLGDINEHLDGIEEINSGDSKRVNMWCHTCHRGRARPMALNEELTAEYMANGLDATVKHYRDLREQFYGRGAYDFGEQGLNGLGYGLLGQKQVEAAIAVFLLNVEYNPESANVYDSLAEAYMTAGNNELAILNYGKSLEKDPDNENAKKQLEALRAKTE